MTLQNKLKSIYETFAAIEGLNITHYRQTSNIPVPYAVWEENGEGSSLEANNHKAQQSIDGFLYYFTKTEFDPMFDTIQDTLNSIDGLRWVYENDIYGDPASENDDTIEHIWTWRLL